MQQEMEMVKEQLQKLSGIEHPLEQLDQNVVRSLQVAEETQKMVVALGAPRDSPVRMAEVEGTPVRRSEGSSVPKGKAPEQANMLGTGQGGRVDVPSSLSGDWHGGRRLKMPVFTRENLDS